jgi:uncharacterized Fe-S cluster-containing radical SAM superfamily protein
MKTDPIKRALELRKTLISDDEESILVADFTDTLQGKDTSKVLELMPNTSTGDYVFRAKINVKDIDPAAAEVYGKQFFDVEKASEAEVESHLRVQEFDFPLWFKHNPGFSMHRAMDYNAPFVFQVGGCNFHDGGPRDGCWYCFVDDPSNNGVIERGKSFLTADETIDSMLAAREKIRGFYKSLGKDVAMRVLRASGGEPIIVLDWILNLWRQAAKRGVDFVGQLDTNLSTGPVVDFFEKEGVFELHSLEKLAEHPVKALTALKGTDEANLQANVQSYTTMEAQKYSLKRIVSAGLDIYPQLYNPNPETLRTFLADFDKDIKNLSLRIHIGPLKLYGPNKARLVLEAQRLGVDSEKFVQEKKKEWDENYARGCEIMDNYLHERYGVRYKQVTRSDVRLKLQG